MKTNVIVSSFVLMALGSALPESFDNLQRALESPQTVTTLSIKDDASLKHLPSKLGTLVNLTDLEISCLENLEELPTEIGQLKKLEKLIIDNGNGCEMSITVPVSIGELSNLKVLRLFGALAPKEIDSQTTAPDAKTKALPATIAKLQDLEELDLGRNALSSIPPEIADLKKLQKLELDYNNVHEIPSFIGELKNLRELSIRSNGITQLPESLSKLSGLKISMGNNYLKLKDQSELRSQFPNATFDFENEYDDDAANEEPHE